MKKPKVTACIIAYNHENFIKDCLEGALAQVVDFDYEIIISEDCSTDNTRKILGEYQKKYPDTKIVNSDANIYFDPKYYGIKNIIPSTETSISNLSGR